jgi:protoporphyrinogen oxidase
VKKRIAVLGAGPMGLAVAYELAIQGFQPTVFEADDRVGGMAATFNFAGLEIERYYHFYCTSDTALFEVLEELQMANRIQWVETKMGYWFEGKIQNWGTPFALLNFRGIRLIDKLRYGLHAFVSVKRDRWESLEHRDAASWIKKWVGNRAYVALWKNLFDYKFYDQSENVSAAWIWSRIRRLGRSRYSIFREKLGYLDGGSGTVLNAMAQVIETNDGQIHLNTPVSKIDFTKTLARSITSSRGTEDFDIVVSTIPLPLVPSIMPQLPEDIKKTIQQINNIAVVCVIVKMKKSLSKNFWLNTNDSRMDIPGLVEYSNLRPMDDHVVYVPFYLPQSHASFLEPNEKFVEKVKTYIKMMNTNIGDEDFLEARVSRYQYAQPICSPGFAEKLPPIQIPIDGLWIADTSYYYPEDRGLSESISLGRKIARSVIKELNSI